MNPSPLEKDVSEKLCRFTTEKMNTDPHFLISDPHFRVWADPFVGLARSDETLFLARPATIPRARSTETGRKANFYKPVTRPG